MKKTDLDYRLKELSKRAVKEEAERMSSVDASSVILPQAQSENIRLLLFKRSFKHSTARKRITVTLVAAILFTLLSTTCMAIPGVREQIVNVFNPSDSSTDDKPSIEEMLKEEKFLYLDKEYSIYDIVSMDTVLLNRIAGAGGSLYRFLERIDEISGNTELSESVLSRLSSPYTVTELCGNGAYRTRLEEISGAFLNLTGAEDFLSFVNTAEADILDSELPLFYHLVTYCGITEEELRTKNKEEASSIFGYPLTENEIKALTSGDGDLVKRQLSEDISYYSKGRLYTPYDLSYCSTDVFIALMNEPEFTEHLCRLSRTYVLDGTDVGSYRDWIIQRYEFFSKGK